MKNKIEFLLDETYWSFVNAIHNDHAQIKIENGKVELCPNHKFEDTTCYVCDTVQRLRGKVGKKFKDFYTISSKRIEEIQSLKRKVEKLQKENEELKKSLEFVQSSVNLCGKTIDKKNEEIEKLKKENEEYKNKYEISHKNSLERFDKIKILQDDIKSLKYSSSLKDHEWEKKIQEKVKYLLEKYDSSDEFIDSNELLKELEIKKE